MIIWSDDRLAFDLLQHRFAGGQARARELARHHPASYVVFDLLGLAGEDLRDQPLRDRRAALETLAREWSPPLQLSPMTDDIEVARRWMIDYRPAGVEGLVIKGADTRYEPGLRRWVKYKLRQTTEVLVGAVIGQITRPEAFIAGLYQSGTLRMVGRSGPLRSAQSLSLANVLTPAGPDHPWPGSIAANRFGPGRERVALTKVDPKIVAEVSADAAQQGGVWRHPLRFVRHVLILVPQTSLSSPMLEVPPVGAFGVSAEISEATAQRADGRLSNICSTLWYGQRATNSHGG